MSIKHIGAPGSANKAHRSPFSYLQHKMMDMPIKYYFRIKIRISINSRLLIRLVRTPQSFDVNEFCGKQLPRAPLLNNQSRWVISIMAITSTLQNGFRDFLFNTIARACRAGETFECAFPVFAIHDSLVQRTCFFKWTHITIWATNQNVRTQDHKHHEAYRIIYKVLLQKSAIDVFQKAWFEQSSTNANT